MIGWNHATLKLARQAARAENETADIDSEVYEGEVQLQITPFVSFSQIRDYKRYLATIKDLKIVSENWSEEEGFSIVVAVKVPMILGRLLQDIPEVARVQVNSIHGRGSRKQQCKKMTVVMKSQPTAEPATV